MNTQGNLAEMEAIFKPIYSDLINSCRGASKRPLCPFFMQWGNVFPIAENSGILFYGRATNGWVTQELDVDKLFDLSIDERIFVRDDQMQWVEDCAPIKKGCYSTKRSAFWRVIRRTASNFYGNGELQHIGWSNLCKIAPDGSNPGEKLFNAQFPAIREIMKMELEFFSPKHIVCLTGMGWCMPFLKFLKEECELKVLYTYQWNEKYSVNVYNIGEKYFYVSEHPQGKKEDAHVDALVHAITDIGL